MKIIKTPIRFAALIRRLLIEDGGPVTIPNGAFIPFETLIGFMAEGSGFPVDAWLLSGQLLATMYDSCVQEPTLHSASWSTMEFVAAVYGRCATAEPPSFVDLALIAAKTLKLDRRALRVRRISGGYVLASSTAFDTKFGVRVRVPIDDPTAVSFGAIHIPCL